MPVREYITHSPDATRAVAAELAQRIPSGSVLALHGDLGAGKTCFVQGLAEALGIDRPITSPTYTLVCEYAAGKPLTHLDLYRLSGSGAAAQMGLDEYVFRDGITAIEWAERAGDLLPAHTIHIRMHAGQSEQERVIRIEEPDPC